MAQQDPRAGGEGESDATWSTYTPPTARAPVGGEAGDEAGGEAGGENRADGSLPVVPYGPATTSSTSSHSGSSGSSASSGSSGSDGGGSAGTQRTIRRVIVAVFAAAVLVPLGIGVVAAIQSYDPGGIPGTSGAGGTTTKDPVRLHTEAGFTDLVEALRAETGSTAVFDAVLYPAYGVVTVPAETRGKRSHSYYYDGDLRRTSQGTTDDPRFDLAQLDPAVMSRLVEKAQTGLVEDPTTVYVIMRRPPDPADGWYSVYAMNEYTESGYFQADRTGKIVNRYVSTE